MDLDRCAVAVTVEVMGGKWKPTILYHLKDRPRRFNELRRLMPDITQRMLTLQLRALEEAGIVIRTVHEQVPPKVEYRLSDYGWTLGPILDAMESWGEAHNGHAPAQVRRGAAPGRARSTASPRGGARPAPVR